MTDWEKKFLGMNFMELEQFHKDNPCDGIPEWFDEWITAVDEVYPFDSIQTRLDAIEKTLDIILSKIGSETAEISVKELIRLKGGHY